MARWLSPNFSSALRPSQQHAPDHPRRRSPTGFSPPGASSADRTGQFLPLLRTPKRKPSSLSFDTFDIFQPRACSSLNSVPVDGPPTPPTGATTQSVAARFRPAVGSNASPPAVGRRIGCARATGHLPSPGVAAGCRATSDRSFSAAPAADADSTGSGRSRSIARIPRSIGGAGSVPLLLACRRSVRSLARGPSGW
jgi:hypothetical protein